MVWIQLTIKHREQRGNICRDGSHRSIWSQYSYSSGGDTRLPHSKPPPRRPAKHTSFANMALNQRPICNCSKNNIGSRRFMKSVPHLELYKAQTRIRMYIHGPLSMYEGVSSRIQDFYGTRIANSSHCAKTALMCSIWAWSCLRTNIKGWSSNAASNMQHQSGLSDFMVFSKSLKLPVFAE